jgi:hypothetical protein
MNITRLRTAAMALVFVQMTSVPSLASRAFDVPYRSEANLKSQCNGEGDAFVAGKEGHTCIWKGGDSVTCNKSSKTCRALTVAASKATKRTKVLQEGGGGGQGGNVSPTVLGSDPGAPPVGGGGLEN